MLRECSEHGYFREEKCPYCGSEGKFLLSDRELSWFGRTLTGILRHFPEKFDLEMDIKGWVNIDDIITNVKMKNHHARWLKPEHIIAIAKTDDKGRYQMKMGKIRSTYGHSIEVSLDLPTDNIPESLYYPSSQEEAEILLETGIRHSDRAMVHLSDTRVSAREAGSHRIKDPVILRIDTSGAIDEGIVIQRAGKHVYISDFIPSEHLSMVEES